MMIRHLFHRQPNLWIGHAISLILRQPIKKPRQQHKWPETNTERHHLWRKRQRFMQHHRLAIPPTFYRE